MAFNITEQRVFEATVAIKIPAGLDAFENQAITCQYNVIDDDAMAATIAAGGDKAALKAMLVSVDGFIDSKGDPVYLDDNLIHAISIRSYLLQPIIKTYYDRIAGKEPELKNV